MPTPPLPSRALAAAFKLAEGRISLGPLAQTCGVTVAAVGLWLQANGRVEDPAMINAIRIAFYRAGVSIEHGAVDIEDVDAGDTMVADGWVVRPVR